MRGRRLYPVCLQSHCEIQLNDTALYLMWQSLPHGSLFCYGQSLANLLTIIGNNGWRRTIISDESDVLKWKRHLGLLPHCTTTCRIISRHIYCHTMSHIQNLLVWQCCLEIGGTMNKSLEIEVGIGPTFADLQSAAKTTIDNSTMKCGRWVWLPTTCSWTGLFLLKTTSTNGTVWWSRTTLFGFGVRGPRHEDQDRIEMAFPEGLEPPIFWFVAKYSIQIELWEY